jgi:hypothetical protein
VGLSKFAPARVLLPQHPPLAGAIEPSRSRRQSPSFLASTTCGRPCTQPVPWHPVCLVLFVFPAAPTNAEGKRLSSMPGKEWTPVSSRLGDLVMAARSRTTVGDLPTSATGIGGPPAKEAVCTAARATPPPLPATLPLTVSQASLPVAVPPEGARKPGLIAWAPVGIAAVVAAVLIGSLALLIRRTPADADPEAAPEVALATGQPQLPPSPPTPLPQGERGEKGSLSESPVKMEPASPALPAPPAPDDPPPANPAAATPSLPRRRILPRRARPSRQPRLLPSITATAPAWTSWTARRRRPRRR